MRPAGGLFVGADLGGSRTRVVVISASGQIFNRADGAGVNWLLASGSAVPRATAEVFELALGGRGEQVQGAVIGVAGVLPIEAPPTDAFRRALGALGVNSDPVVMSDLDLLFRAFAGWRPGLAQVVGTGAIGARFSDTALLRTVDGYGPTLGDVGSGYWIGRRALTIAVRELNGRSARTALSTIVIERLMASGIVSPSDSPDRQLWAVIRSIGSGPRKEVADLALVVLQAAAAGDHVATTIVREAANAIIDSLSQLEPQADEPLVLGGSLLTNDNVLSAEVRGWADSHNLTVTLGDDSALAAARLAQEIHS